MTYVDDFVEGSLKKVSVQVIGPMGKVGMAHKKGSVLIYSWSKGKRYDITMCDVLFVPTIRKNLLSVRQMTEVGCSVSFKLRDAEVRKDGVCSMQAKDSPGGLYCVQYANTVTIDFPARTKSAQL
eukprot:TRINITY_DN1266_c2_g1_i1.p1 TRINITY_DN1266_c2_g1~~TRINITY_DN1266_c2_g1_i1.p1  ORF type:complete len:125 (+),score=12.15 TRINITY_DN1266_c2_g1_i1:204-578(+)